MYQLLTQNQGWYVRRNRLSLFSPCSWIESRASVGDGAHRPNIVRMEILDRARGVIDLRDRGRTDGINVTVVTIIQQQRDRPVRIPHKLLRRCTNSSRLTQTIAVAAEISLPPPLVQNGSVDWAEFRVPALKLGTDLFVRRGQEVWRWLVTARYIANKELTTRTNYAHALPRINKKCSQLKCAWSLRARFRANDRAPHSRYNHFGFPLEALYLFEN